MTKSCIFHTYNIPLHEIFQSSVAMKKLLLLTTLLLAGLSYASGDTIYLKNGLTIEGKIEEMNPLQNVVVCTPDGRRFTYPIAEILSIKLSDTHHPNPAQTAGHPDTVPLPAPDKEHPAPAPTHDAGLPEPARQEHSVRPAAHAGEPHHPAPHPEARQRFAMTRMPHHDAPLPVEPEKKHVAKQGYHGFVSISSAVYLPNYLQIGFSTTHGAQITPHLFIGGGMALNILTYGSNGDVFLPIYTEVRTNWGENIAQFSAGTRIGITIGDKMGFYWHLDAGLRLGFTPKFAMHIAPFIELQPLMDSEYIYNTNNEPYSYIYKWNLSCAAGLRIGFEF